MECINPECNHVFGPEDPVIEHDDGVMCEMCAYWLREAGSMNPFPVGNRWGEALENSVINPAKEA